VFVDDLFDLLVEERVVRLDGHSGEVEAELFLPDEGLAGDHLEDAAADERLHRLVADEDLRRLLVVGVDERREDLRDLFRVQLGGRKLFRRYDFLLLKSIL
jgi:hypothetical protein